MDRHTEAVISIESDKTVPGEHRTVSRVMFILEQVTNAREPVTLAALCARLHAPKSSIHGLIQGLISTGYLRDATGGYVPGPAVGLLTGAASPVLVRAAKDSLAALSESSGESASLCLLVGDSVVYADVSPSAHVIRYSPPLHVRRPLYPASAGKMFLARMPLARRTRLLRALVTEADLPSALEEIAEVDRRGVALNRGETVPGVFAAASPVVWRDDVVACLQVAGPESRLADRLDEIAESVRIEAGRLSEDPRS